MDTGVRMTVCSSQREEKYIITQTRAGGKVSPYLPAFLINDLVADSQDS